MGIPHRQIRFNNCSTGPYGWPADISEEDALAKLLELNLSRAAAAEASVAQAEASEEE